MPYRELSSSEQTEVFNWFFSKGIEASEAAYRISLVERIAASENCPVIETHRYFASEKLDHYRKAIPY